MSTASQSTSAPRCLCALACGACLAVSAVTCVTSCARGPVLSESAVRLRTDVALVLDHSARRFGVQPRALADQSVPCGDGLARRTLRAEVRLPSGAPPRALIDQATALSLDASAQRGYRLTGPPSGPRRDRSFTLTRAVPQVTLTVRLRGGRHPTMTLDGTTACLPDDT